MRRILALLRRDMLSTRKDFILVYVLVAPMLMALGARIFLPIMGQTTVNVVVTPDFPAPLMERLEPYLNVEVAGDRAALERRVKAYDDIVGIVAAPDGGYTLVLEGNETHDSEVLPRMVLQKVLSGTEMEMAQVDVASDQIPLREWFGVFLVLGTLFIGSTVMGFQIIEDKESRIAEALGVSPLRHSEYILARSVLVVGLSVVIAFASSWILGLTAFDHLQLLVAVLAATGVAALVGFVIGALSGNQIAGIANVKFGMLLFILPAVLAMLMPQGYQAALYWIPSYWSFVSFRSIFLEGAGWATLLPQLGWTLVTSVALITLTYPWLKTKLELSHR